MNVFHCLIKNTTHFFFKFKDVRQSHLIFVGPKLIPKKKTVFYDISCLWNWPHTERKILHAEVVGPW